MKMIMMHKTLMLLCIIALLQMSSALMLSRSMVSSRLMQRPRMLCMSRELHMLHMSSTGLHMSSTKGSTGGSTKIDTRIKSKTNVKPTFKQEIEREWRLVLHDDDFHTIEDVVEIIRQHCPLCTERRANDVTMQVHVHGMGTICMGNKKLIDEYTKKLQAEGLTVSMSPDEDFEPEDVLPGEEGGGEEGGEGKGEE